jgi:hypothetical protein
MDPPNKNINMSATEYQEIFQKKQEDFNRYIQEMEVPIVRLDLYLAGKEMIEDDQGEERMVRIEGIKERMNQAGREFIKSKLRTFLSPNTYMSAIDDKMSDRVYEVEIQCLQDDLYPRMNEFGCSKNDISAIYDKCCSIIYLALKKARGDKQAIFQGMSSNNIQQPPPQQQGSAWGIPQQYFR